MIKAKVGWILPDPLAGSGGHLTIINSANSLAARGFKSFMYFHSLQLGVRNNEIKQYIENFFQVTLHKNIECFSLWPNPESKEFFDILFATAWETAFFVNQYPHCSHRAYFIQEYEAFFHLMGDGYLKANYSYQLPLHHICTGKWLSNYIQEVSGGRQSYQVDFGISTSIYYPRNVVREPYSVAFLFQPEKPRRCAWLGVSALNTLFEHIPNLHVYSYGSSKTFSANFSTTHLGLLSRNDLSSLYNRCSVGLSMSATNPSRVPFEMLACGLPVVELSTISTSEDFPPGLVIRSSPDEQSLAFSMFKILTNNALKNEISDKAGLLLSSYTLEKGYDQFYEAVLDILKIHKPDNSEFTSQAFYGKVNELDYSEWLNSYNSAFLISNHFEKPFFKADNSEIINNRFASVSYKMIVAIYKSNLLYKFLRPLITNQLRHKLKLIFDERYRNGS